MDFRRRGGEPMRKAVLSIAVLGVCLLAVGFAQQPDTPEQTSIDLYKKKITVNYLVAPANSSNGVGGMAPLGKAWPLGGAAPATLHTEGDLVFKGLVVPKGDYSLYLLADSDQWQLIINKNTNPKAAAYDSKMDLGRVPMVLRNSPATVDQCKVTLSKFAARAARLDLALANKVASAPFTLDWVPGDPEW
jgi:hypothetical protein